MPSGSKKHKFTPREVKVVRLVSLGCTIPQAGAILGISPSTVDNHKVRAMGKLGADKVAVLTRLGLKLGVTSMSDKLTPVERHRSGRKDDGWNS